MKNGFVEGVQGKGGGYRLSRAPEECTVGEIIRLTEGNLAHVTCLDCCADVGEKRDACKALSMWMEFYRMTNECFDGTTVEDLANGKYL